MLDRPHPRHPTPFGHELQPPACPCNRAPGSLPPASPLHRISPGSLTGFGYHSYTCQMPCLDRCPSRCSVIYREGPLCYANFHLRANSNFLQSRFRAFGSKCRISATTSPNHATLGTPPRPDHLRIQSPMYVHSDQCPAARSSLCHVKGSPEAHHATGYPPRSRTRHSWPGGLGTLDCRPILAHQCWRCVSAPNRTG